MTQEYPQKNLETNTQCSTYTRTLVATSDNSQKVERSNVLQWMNEQTNLAYIHTIEYMYVNTNLGIKRNEVLIHVTT